MSPFNATDQNGQLFTKERLQGSVWIADFFYSTCKLACPRMTAEMRKIQKEFAGEERVRLVSISVDPARDSVRVLAEYAVREKAIPGKWFFLTSDAETAKRLQREAAPEMDPENPTHSRHFFLVDGEGYVRGFYKSSSADELAQLVEDTRALLAHPARP